MLRRPGRTCRRGASLVEAAIVYPITLLLTLGLGIVALGVFRYQQIVNLAREGARWASVRGLQYQTELNADGKHKAVTQTDIRNHIVAMSAGLDTSTTVLVVNVTWNTSNALTDSTTGKKNTVKVKVTYTWLPEAYFGGMTFVSTSEAVMSY